ncbi:MAG: putative quinol monooxygenase [Novosphingobium sp.]
MILVTGKFRLPPDRLAEARAALRRVIEATRAEPGCLDYAYAEDLLEPGLIRVSEKWEGREALATHFEAAHMKQWQRERAEFGMTDRDMAAYTISAAEIL